jgi:hypothetical protein
MAKKHHFLEQKNGKKSHIFAKKLKNDGLDQQFDIMSALIVHQ